MPILLPVLVRRSVRDTTVAATRPALAPDFTERENSVQDCTLSFCSSDGVFVERMAGQEEADGVVFALQLVGRQPGLDRGDGDGLAAATMPPNISFCPTETASCVRCAVDMIASTAACARARFGSSASKAPEAARLSSTRLLTARGLMRRAKSVKIGERLVAARRDDRVHRLPADAFERRERVVDRVAFDVERRRPSG